jgi:tRNA N6-adenosine threonylcarbamoyltransferase
VLLLGIETSCDDTAAAVLRDEREILSNVVASQLTHREYGGVVPELASRQHLKHLLPVMRAALDRAGVAPEQLDGIAATAGPGLLGSLLVGLCTAQAYALGLGKPFVAVHHIEGHVMANWLVEDMHFPCVVLVISGGHTQLFRMRRIGDYEELGSTRDDAAGEAFDKIGKMLGIPYPAGPVFDKLATRGDRRAVPFPRARLKDGELDFSFSGLKTAARLLLEREGFAPRTKVRPIGHNEPSSTKIATDSVGAEGNVSADGGGNVGSYGTGNVLAANPPAVRAHPDDLTPAELEALPQRAFDILASAQEAIVDMLAEKLVAAVRATGVQHAYLAGGVAANSRLRERLREGLEPLRAVLHYPPPRLCTDNAAMIACVGYFRLRAGRVSGPDTNAFARGPVESWT